MTPFKQKLVIEQGRTFKVPIRWESDQYSYAAISAITASAPCRITTAAPHGIPDGWRAAVVSARGMVEINAVSNPPSETELRRVKLLTASQVEINDLSSADFTPYTSGGFLQFRTPRDLTGYTARMTIKDKVGGVTLLTLTSVNGGVAIDTSGYVIELRITATATAAITWKSGTYDLELVSPSGDVTCLLYGSVAVTFEVTT